MARQPKPWYRKDRKAWFVTIDGKRHNLGKNKAEAFDRFHQLMTKPKQRRVVSESLPALIDLFLDWVQKNRAPDTYEWYQYRLERFAQRYPDLCVGDLKPFHVQEWVDSYPDLSKTSRRNYFRSIKRCIKWNLQQGYIEANPIEHLQVPGGERNEQIVTLDEYQTLLEYCRDQTFGDLIVTTWETGCRPQELLRVEARHVDLTNNRWVFPPSEAKGKKAPRIVYLTDPAVEITKRLVAEHPTGKLFRNSRNTPWKTESVACGFDRIQRRMGRDRMEELGDTISDEEIADFIPQLKSHRTVKGETVAKSQAELKLEAKTKLLNYRAVRIVPRYSLYVLRHSWATRALQSGLDGLTVAILMGHADPSTLARVYQHLSHNPQHLLEQAQRAAS